MDARTHYFVKYFTLGQTKTILSDTSKTLCLSSETIRLLFSMTKGVLLPM